MFRGPEKKYNLYVSFRSYAVVLFAYRPAIDAHNKGQSK